MKFSVYKVKKEIEAVIE